MADSDNQHSEHSDSESDLHLSCRSSSFDDDDNVEGSDSEWSGAEEAVAGADQPIHHDPDRPADAGQNQPARREVIARPERVGNIDWCTCGNCVIMPTWEECVCCNEPPEVVLEKATRAKEDEIVISCLLDHPGFEHVCLNRDVLKVAYYAYRQRYRRELEDNNARNRYIGYRQLTRWCWGWLGPRVRVPLPSCSVHRIRTTYPSADGRYHGFEEPPPLG